MDINHKYGSGQSGGGVSLYDFNQDGLDDLSISSQEGDSLYFYINQGEKFRGVHLNGVDNNRETKQILWVDIDNDNDLDLFVASFNYGNKLYRNDGDLSFSDITITSGLSLDSMPSMGATFGDYDNDGDLDLYICNYHYHTKIWPNFLYQNNGDGTFVEMTSFAGVTDSSGYSFCATFIDYDRDGLQDLYVANDFDSGNKLYHNNGDGTFGDSSAVSGAGIMIDAMSVTIGDYNNDNWPDIYVTNLPDGNVLLTNNSDGTFSQPDSAAGAGFYDNSWGANFYDFDNDQYEDIYVSGMWPFDENKSAQMYQNNQSSGFNAWTEIGFVGDTAWSFANAVGDLNDDGAGDIVVVNALSDSTMIWMNESVSNNNWIKIELEGTISNSMGIGSIIELYTDGLSQSRYVQCGEAYLCQNSKWKHFGLGDNQKVDSLIIYWPSGLIDSFYNFPANNKLKVIENGGITDVESDLEYSEIYVYPNPTSGLMYLVNDSKCIGVTNSMGQSAEYSYDNGVLTFSRNCKSGLYTIFLMKTDQSIVTEKVLLTR